jgi:hypothetical protein
MIVLQSGVVSGFAYEIDGRMVDGVIVEKEVRTIILLQCRTKYQYSSLRLLVLLLRKKCDRAEMLRW